MCRLPARVARRFGGRTRGQRLHHRIRSCTIVARARPGACEALSILVWASSIVYLQPAWVEGAPGPKPRPELQAIEEPWEAAPAAVVADTVWFGDWEFGTGACDPAGWTPLDNHILRDSSNYWFTGSNFAGSGGISGQAAILSGTPPCGEPGYDNSWDYAIVCKYAGLGATLSFDYLLDSEEGYDFLIIEADSSCASDARVDYATNPADAPDRYRLDLFTNSGLVTAGNVTDLALPDFGAPEDTHCVYIRFRSDIESAPADGFYPTTLGAALVVDDIAITGGLAYVETFESALHPLVSFVNAASATPFGLWARLHSHATDNDVCSEAHDCAWIFSDPSLPAFSPGMAFGPDGAVVRSWLDNVIVSPWVSLPASQGATFLGYRDFPGNVFNTGRIAVNWSLRTKWSPGGSTECVSPWKRVNNWNSLNTFTWRVLPLDLTTYVEPDAVAIQLRYRVADYQYIAGAAPPSPLDPGPGPYLDRVRLGRVVMNGPEINLGFGHSETAQDNFPSELTDVDPVEDYTPGTDRLGVSDFSPPIKHLGATLGIWFSKTRDSLTVRVRDVRGAGGVPSISFHGAIVAGPHVGKAPPPWTVGDNGFFEVPADSVRNWAGIVQPDYYFADLDDRYFRGGDVLYYLWSATDAGGGYASLPDGLTSSPASVAQAEQATGGLFEVSFLPSIDWDPAYLARIQADPHGKLDPTPAEAAASAQRNCILYQRIDSSVRRSGPANRTAFMHTLDRLGYGGAYDVYDQLALGTANNQVASRASVDVAGGYSLIILDADVYDIRLSIPQGSNVAEGRVPQSQWYQAWLAGAAASPAGRATLWLIGRDLAGWTSIAGHITGVEAASMGVGSGVSFGTHPPIAGQNVFTWADGSSSDFAADRFVLSTFRCGNSPVFDTIEATGSGVVTHRHTSSSMPGAVVMNANPAATWNTVFMSLIWDELIDADGIPASQVTGLADKIVRAALADSCEHNPNPTGVPDTPGLDAIPRQTALYPNVPNPFNPVTTIRFDLAQSGKVQLRIYDVAGRLVRTLIDEEMPPGRDRTVIWNGLDDKNGGVPSGVYFYRLETTHASLTRKLVVMK